MSDDWRGETVDRIRTLITQAAPEVVEDDDQQLLARVRRALSAQLGQERAAPALVRVFRHPAGIPQYTPGHLQRVAAVRAAQARHPGLYCVGNHLQGIGVKDCAREAARVADQVRAFVGGPRPDPAETPIGPDV